MSTAEGGGDIVRDGLVLLLDAANTRSYPGTGTVWSDLSRGGNTGTLTNGPTYSSANGGSIVFDGVNNYVNITNQIQFERTDPFSLCIWIYPTLVSNNMLINNETIQTSPTPYRGYRLSIATTGVIAFSLRNTINTNQASILTLSSLTANNWYNIVATYDGSSNTSGMKIYINGIPQSFTIENNNLTNTTISNQTTWIGLRRPTTTGPFVGRIPQASIYNRTLSASEVSQNFNATRARFGI
jgi:hypothetical protein